MKVRRVLEYEGSPEWIEQMLKHSYVQGDGIGVVWHGCSIREVSVEKEDDKADLTRTDEYTEPIPNYEVEACLKLLRTVRGACLKKGRMSEAVTLSQAHRVLVELVKECEEEVEKEKTDGAVRPDHSINMEGRTDAEDHASNTANLRSVEDQELGQRFLDCEG